MASTKDASVVGVIDPQLAYTIEGAARVMGTTLRWIKDALIKPGLIPYTQATPRSPILLLGRDIIAWAQSAQKPGSVKAPKKQQAASNKPNAKRIANGSDQLIGTTRILTRVDIEAAYISAANDAAAQRKFDGWLRGYRHLGERTEPLNRPLRHFRDGRSIMVRTEWLQEFIDANSDHLANDLAAPLADRSCPEDSVVEQPSQPAADQVLHVLNHSVPEPQPSKAKGKGKPVLQLSIDDDTLLNKSGLVDLFGRSEQWVNTHFRSAPWIVAGEDRFLFWSDVKVHLKALRRNSEATPEAATNRTD